MTEQEEILERARTYTGYEAYPCPLCTYENGVLKERCSMHKKIAELEAECRNSYNAGISVGEKERLRLGGRILELEATVEKLKCCGNCKHEPEFFSDNGCCVMCVKLDKWEAK